MSRAVPVLTDAQRAAFVAAARRYIGVPWRHQGRDKRGLDCGGLVLVALADIGVEPLDAPRGYGREPYRNSLEAMCMLNLGDPQPASYRPRVGDIGVFHVGRSAPNHLAIFGDYVHGGLSMIHAYAINREVVEAPFDESWEHPLRQVYAP